MFAAYSRNTEAGARRIAAQRGLSLPTPVAAPEPRRAPVWLPVVSNVIPFQHPKGSAKRVIEMVARMHGASYDAVVGPSRNFQVVNARQAAICAVKEHTGWSTSRIGALFNRDYSTVVHTLQKRGYR